MAFVNDTFPELRLIHGISKAYNDVTQVFGNGTHEYRIRRSTRAPYMWSFPTRDLYVDDAQELISFYEQIADGSLNSFRFKDPDDYVWSLNTLTHYKTDKWVVSSKYGAPIWYGSITEVYLNGIAQGSFTIQLDDDLPYIQIPGSSSGSNVQIDGTYEFVVRFDSPLQYSINALDVNNDTLAYGIGDVVLKEVNEHA